MIYLIISSSTDLSSCSGLLICPYHTSGRFKNILYFCRYLHKSEDYI
ncbi:hypothetical protein X975_09407, partial [Stegodyphus mimosarum]